MNAPRRRGIGLVAIALLPVGVNGCYQDIIDLQRDRAADRNIAGAWRTVTPDNDLSAADDRGACNGNPCRRSRHTMEYIDSSDQIVVVGGGTGRGCAGGWLNDVWAYEAVSNRWSQQRGVDEADLYLHGTADHAMAYDKDSDRLWILGGECTGAFGYYKPKDNLFFQLTMPEIHGVNVVLREAAFAYGGGMLLAFSGSPSAQANPGNLTSVFSIDGMSWSPYVMNRRPEARFSSQFVFAAEESVFILFGGRSGEGLFDDTWLYDAGDQSWSRPGSANAPNTRPAARYQHAMVYDSRHNRVIVHGGNSGEVLGDSWSLNPSTMQWRQIVGDGPRRRLAGMAYDKSRDMVALFGGNDESGMATSDLLVFDH